MNQKDKKMGNDLTVIVITHNRLDYTKRTIQSLLNSVPEANFLIFDNKLSFEDNGQLSEYFKYSGDYGRKISYFHNYENSGWGKAVNISVSLINNMYLSDFIRDYILISNNDIEYKDGWYEQCVALYEKYPKIGILGVWKHTAHGVLEDRGDLIVKDQMPAVGWLMTPEHLNDIGTFAEHGPCSTKGGNGEDVDYCIRARLKGYLVAAPVEDVGVHIDGY